MKSKLIIFLGVAIAFLAFKVTAQTSTNKIVGKWYAEEMDQSVIEIMEAKDGFFEGIIRSSSNEKFLEQKVIYDFMYSGKDKNYKGKIYSISRKMELEGTIEVENDNKLKVTGKKYFFSKTYYWEKVN